MVQTMTTISVHQALLLENPELKDLTLVEEKTQPEGSFVVVVVIWCNVGKVVVYPVVCSEKKILFYYKTTVSLCWSSHSHSLLFLFSTLTKDLCFLV